jgi:hypothetical protein
MAVTDLDEPPLQAAIMMSSSMTSSLVLGIVGQPSASATTRIDILVGTTLHDEDILVAHRRLDLDTRLSVGELSKLDLVGLSAELLANGIRQDWMAEAAKDTGAAHD